MSENIDLNITSIEKIKTMRPGIYACKTIHNEPAIIKVSKSDPIVKLEAVQRDGTVRVCEYYADGTSREHIRPKDLEI